MGKPASRRAIASASRLTAAASGVSKSGPGRISGMSKLLMLAGSTAGSYAGWWLGGHIGIMTAFMLSVAGTGVGLFAGRRVARNYE
jgi:hypothetical protein